VPRAGVNDFASERGLSTEAFKVVRQIGRGGFGEKFMAAEVTAKVDHFSIAFVVKGSRLIHRRSANGVMAYGFRFIHGQSFRWDIR
jgi:hypothetical protein